MNSVGLSWVQSEVAASLTRAQAALEEFATGYGGKDCALECTRELHQVRAVLSLLGYSGLAMLIEEMERTTAPLAEEGRSTDPEIFETVMTGIIQAGDYLEYLGHSNPDAPAVVMPVLNDLRALRGAELVSLSSLFRPVRRGKLPRPAPQRRLSARQVRHLLAQVREKLHPGLAQWFNGDADAGLRRVQKVLRALEKYGVPESTWTLTWLLGGVVEAIHGGALDGGKAVRRLIAQSERYMHTVAEGSGSKIARPPTNLLKNLLYCAARAQPPTPRIEEIRRTFDLDGFFEHEEVFLRARDVFAGPSLSTLRAVADALRDEMEYIEGQLDACSHGAVTGLDAVARRLVHVADSFGLLNLGNARDDLMQQARKLEELHRQRTAPASTDLLGTAAALLHASQTLDTMVRKGLRASEIECAQWTGSQVAAFTFDPVETRQLTATVLGEVGSNLAMVEEVINRVLEPETTAPDLDEMHHRIDQASGALKLLGLARMAQCLDRWQGCARRALGRSLSRMPAEVLDSLATAIVSLEYVLESLAGRQPTRGAQLTQVDHELAGLESYFDELGDTSDTEITAEPLDPQAPAAVVVTALPLPDAAAESEAAVLLAFQEELADLQEELGQHALMWFGQPADDKQRSAVRRVLHRVKGSSRMVGAMRLGELAGTMEKVVGRSARGPIGLGAEVFESLSEFRDLIPELLDAFVNDTPSPEAANDLLLALNRLLRAETRIREPMQPRIDISLSLPGELSSAYDWPDRIRSHLHITRTLLETREVTDKQAAMLVGRMRAVLGVVRRARKMELAKRCAYVAATLSTKTRKAPPRSQLIRAARSLDAIIDHLDRRASTNSGAAPAPEPRTHARDGNRDFTDSEQREVWVFFANESTELLETSEEALLRLRERPQDHSLVREIQRALHTLKGSANTAAVPAVGDLAHSLESVLTRVTDTAESPLPALFDLVEGCLDRLSEMTDALRSSQPVRPATDLIARADAFAHSRMAPLTGNESRKLSERRMALADIALSDQAPATSPAPQRSDRVAISGHRLDQLGRAASSLSLRQIRLNELLHSIDTDVRALAGVHPTSVAGHPESASLDAIGRRLERALLSVKPVLAEQRRYNAELQYHLIQARLRPFSVHVPRFARALRVALGEAGKHGNLHVQGAGIELDRILLDRLISPIEHMLRNAAMHGIETPHARAAAAKSEAGVVELTVKRDASNVVVEVRDDGAGLDEASLASVAQQRGLVPERSGDMTADDLHRLVFTPGVSTADELTQLSGRGMGLDMVNSEIAQLGGTIQIDSKPGVGTRFIVTIALEWISNAYLILNVTGQLVAVPFMHIISITLAKKDEVSRRYQHRDSGYTLVDLPTIVGGVPSQLLAGEPRPVVLVEVDDVRFAIDGGTLVGQCEAPTKENPDAVAGCRGAVSFEGRDIPIIDLVALTRSGDGVRAEPVLTPVPASGRDTVGATVMVVDDSITVRKVTEKLLSRNGMKVLVARDGVEALAMLQDTVPDAILLDIEMPRMDGFEMTRVIRADARLSALPIIMITSRVGSKHSELAREIGVDHYLGKPYQNQDLLSCLSVALGTGDRVERSDADLKRASS